MPPRKRTESAPKEEPVKEAVVAAGDEGLEQVAESVSGESAPASEATVTASDDSAPQASAEESDGDGGQNPPQDGPAPERSDLQTVDRPCEECHPRGWPEGAYAVGCTHGTWVRAQD